MSGIRLPLNAYCVDCGGMFRRSTGVNLIRCKNCRKGKEGVRSGMKKGQNEVCSVCGKRKYRESTVCRRCYRVMNKYVSSNKYKEIRDRVNLDVNDNPPYNERIKRTIDPIEEDEHYYHDDGKFIRKLRIKIPTELAKKRKENKRKRLNKIIEKEIDKEAEEDMQAIETGYSWIYGDKSREYEALRVDVDEKVFEPVMPVENEFQKIITEDIMDDKIELKLAQEETSLSNKPSQYLGFLKKYIDQGYSELLAKSKAIAEYNRINPNNPIKN